ncbi:MAG: proline dehydrogenase family protein [Cyclobacteriaceae bacterium]
MTFDDTAIAFKAKSDSDLRKTHFLFSSMKKPWMVKTGTVLTSVALKVKLPVKRLIKSTIFDQFCGGESINDCAQTINQLGEFRVHTILDYSVEGQESEESFDSTIEELVRSAVYAKNNEHIPFCVSKFTGIGSMSLMTKIQSGQKLSLTEQQQFEKFKERADRLAKTAHDNHIKFLIDAEDSWVQDVIDQIAYDLMLKYNKERPVVYNTYQLYRHEALDMMKTAHKKITDAGCFFGAKLVRGAYMEKERERAEELNYPDPIQPDKASTDRDYDAAMQYAIDHIDTFSICAGTHNEQSSALLTEMMAQKGIEKSDERVYFAQLLGMSDNISFKLADEGYNVAKYVPYGPVEKVMPYLFRRANENTSIAGQTGRQFSLIQAEMKRRKK